MASFLHWQCKCFTVRVCIPQWSSLKKNKQIKVVISPRGQYLFFYGPKYNVNGPICHCWKIRPIAADCVYAVKKKIMQILAFVYLVWVLALKKIIFAKYSVVPVKNNPNLNTTCGDGQIVIVQSNALAVCLDDMKKKCYNLSTIENSRPWKKLPWRKATYILRRPSW